MRNLMNRDFVIGNFPFLENDFDALTDYELFSKMVCYARKLAISNQTFVNNLDKKLDEMYNNGQLENLITQFLEMKNTYTYNNVSEMKEASNLVADSFARTSGFNSYNDGGGSFYKIRAKEVSDVIDERYLIELENDLVAELVIINTLDVRQLGIFPSSDNTNDFNSIASIIEELNPLYLIINGDYVIGDTVTFENLDNVNIEFKGIISAKSYEDTEKPIFILDSCDNININNYNVTSTVDKHEPSPQGHVRESYLGSCRIGIKLATCHNVNLNNCKFTNMYWDVFPHGDDPTDRTTNVHMNNTISTNSTMPVYASNIDGLYVNDFYCRPKKELGAGNHVFYMNHDCDNLYYNNVDIETDGYCGFSFAFNNPYNTPYDNVHLSNIYLKGTGAIYCISNASRFTVDNFYYDYVDSLVGTNDILLFTSGEVNIRDSVFNNNNFRLLRLNNNCTCIIDNITHNSIRENSDRQIIYLGSTNNELTIKNSKIKCEVLFYNGLDYNNLTFKNCEFYTTTSTYFQSNRNNNSKILYIGCIFNFSNNQNFSYQAGVEYANTVYILASFLNGYNNISGTSNDSSFIIVGSYKDYELIESW